jgi:uncharacterized phage-associated protein
MFKERKAAQMAAFLLDRAGGKLNVLKLTKLLYLAERESMKAHGIQISGDRMVSMPKGPVLSQTLDLTSGHTISQDWEALIEDREQHDVTLRKTVTREDFKDMSDATLTVLESVWAEFGNKDQWELVDFTHDHCAEWEDPNGSSLPIPAKRVFAAVGMDHETAEFMAKELQAQNYFDSILGDEPIEGGQWQH